MEICRIVSINIVTRLRYWFYFDRYPSLSSWPISSVFQKELCFVGYESAWLYILLVHVLITLFTHCKN